MKYDFFEFEFLIIYVVIKLWNIEKIDQIKAIFKIKCKATFKTKCNIVFNK